MDPNKADAENPSLEPTADQLERKRQSESDIDEEVARNDERVRAGEMDADHAREIYLLLDEKKERGY